MKVPIKRRRGTTVPRKLELVNVRCVGTSTSQGKGRVIVSQSQAAIQTAPLPISGGAGAPPFWELEGLIADGVPRETALAMIAARRHRYDAVLQPHGIDTLRRPRSSARYEPLTVLLTGA